MRFWVWRMPLLMAVLLSACSQGDDAAPQDWSSYLAAAAKAERIDDLVQRCLAYPDLPGNDWPQGSARARCPLLRKATPSLEEIEAVFAQPGGAAALDRLFAGLLDAHYADSARREAIFFAYQAFGASEASRRIAERWHAQAPGSAYARMALGREIVAAASGVRGSESYDDTPERDIQTMRRLVAQAVPLLRGALQAEPRLSTACVDLMFAGRLISDEELRDANTAHCLRVDPLSWNVRFQWQMGLDPRWHTYGKHDDPFAKLDESVEAIRPLVPNNPALGGLLARAVGMRAFLPIVGGRPVSEMAEGLETASRMAPDPLFIGEAGVAAKEKEDLPRAAAYLSQAIRLAPGNARFHGARSDVRRKMEDFEGAIADARRAIELDGGVGKYHSSLGLSLTKLGRTEEARTAFHAAMQYPAQRQWAFRRWCETYILRKLMPEEALSCTQGMIGEYPDDAEALFMRSWVLYETDAADADAMAARFREAVDETDPRQRQMLSELTRIAGQSSKKKSGTQ